MLLTSTQRIQVLLAAAPATNQLPIMASWADVANDASTLTPGSLRTTTSGVTAVNVVAAPATGFMRQLKYLSVFNADTAAVTLTIQVLDGTVVGLLSRTALPINSRLEYVQDAGFRVFDSSGAVLGVGPGAQIDVGTATGRVATWDHAASRWMQGANAEDARGNLRDMPIVIRNAAHTFVLDDRGSEVIKSDTSAPPWTIPADGTPAWPIGIGIRVSNDGASGNVTITPATGVTLTEGTTTGAFALLPGQSRLLRRTAANTWRLRL